MFEVREGRRCWFSNVRTGGDFQPHTEADTFQEPLCSDYAILIPPFSKKALLLSSSACVGHRTNRKTELSHNFDSAYLSRRKLFTPVHLLYEHLF